MLKGEGHLEGEECLEGVGHFGFCGVKKLLPVETCLVWQPVGVASRVATGKGQVKGKLLAGAGVLGRITAVKLMVVGVD